MLSNPTTEVELVNLWRELLLGFPIALKDLAKILLNAPMSSSATKSDGKHIVPRTVVDSERALENVMEEYSRVKFYVILEIPRCRKICIQTEGGEFHFQEKLLLVILGNCNFTRNHVLPRLFDSFSKYGFPKADNVTEVSTSIPETFSRQKIYDCELIVLQEALKSFDEVDNFFFNTYMELKSDPIIGVLEQHMYTGRFDWATCPRIIGVRPYIKQILLDVITVYCEVRLSHGKTFCKVLYLK